jgi:hypothetical protein
LPPRLLQQLRLLLRVLLPLLLLQQPLPVQLAAA